MTLQTFEMRDVSGKVVGTVKGRTMEEAKEQFNMAYAKELSKRIPDVDKWIRSINHANNFLNKQLSPFRILGRKFLQPKTRIVGEVANMISVDET